ncbi:UPF0047-domain-containing protein [Xylariaceae sp. FL0594]|nr:UPF0047-domain-containing protein [Xylariaceae sp. FL0594]
MPTNSISNHSMPSPTTPESGSRSRTQNNILTISLLLLVLVSLFPSLFHQLILLPFTYLNPFAYNKYRAAVVVGVAPDVTPSPLTSSATTTTTTSTTMWFQKQFSLPARSRGSYLVTSEVLEALPEIRQFKVGLLNLFVQHTSCALSLNENWDKDVRADMSDALDRIVPESGPKGQELYRHSAEGSDDMPAHVKSALIGASVTIPIKDGKLVSHLLF